MVASLNIQHTIIHAVDIRGQIAYPVITNQPEKSRKIKPPMAVVVSTSALKFSALTFFFWRMIETGTAGKHTHTVAKVATNDHVKLFFRHDVKFR